MGCPIAARHAQLVAIRHSIDNLLAWRPRSPRKPVPPYEDRDFGMIASGPDADASLGLPRPRASHRAAESDPDPRKRRAAPATPGRPALQGATSTATRRPHLLVRPPPARGRVAARPHPGEAGHGNRLAPARLHGPVALEVPAGSAPDSPPPQRVHPPHLGRPPRVGEDRIAEELSAKFGIG